MLTQARLKELLIYDPESGLFKRFICRGGQKAGNIAGTLDSHGHRQIKIDRRLYLAHRLAWLYVYGSMPELFLDHINGLKDDNRIANLRISTNAENCQNQKTPKKHGKSGYLGVSFHKPLSKYRAAICINYKNMHLGYFDSQEDAHKAYIAAKRILHPFNTL